LTPATVHYGQVEAVRAKRQDVLSAANAAHPERFVKGCPTVPMPPTEVWINPPALELPAAEIAYVTSETAGPQAPAEPSVVIQPGQRDHILTKEGKARRTGEGAEHLRTETLIMPIQEPIPAQLFRERECLTQLDTFRTGLEAYIIIDDMTGDFLELGFFATWLYSDMAALAELP